MKNSHFANCSRRVREPKFPQSLWKFVKKKRAAFGNRIVLDFIELYSIQPFITEANVYSETLMTLRCILRDTMQNHYLNWNSCGRFSNKSQWTEIVHKKLTVLPLFLVAPGNFWYHSHCGFPIVHRVFLECRVDSCSVVGILTLHQSKTCQQECKGKQHSFWNLQKSNIKWRK